MKGMMGLLERAGLVSRVEEAGAAPPESATDAMAAAQAPAFEPPAPAVAAVAAGTPLAQIYASAGLGGSPFPAERLLKLIDGLRAMDEGLRRQTIQALDMADDSWSIEDPLTDARAKVAAIQAHVAGLRSGVEAAEAETRERLAASQQRHEQSGAAIRQQIEELQALLAREQGRHAQECAALEAELAAKRAATDAEVQQLARQAGELQSLVTQFATTTQQEGV